MAEFLYYYFQGLRMTLQEDGVVKTEGSTDTFKIAADKAAAPALAEHALSDENVTYFARIIRKNHARSMEA